MNNKVTQTKSLSRKITIRILGILFIVFAIFLTQRIYETKKDLAMREMEKLEMLAEKNAGIVKSLMDKMVGKQDLLASVIVSSKNYDEEERVEYIKEMLEELKQGEENVLSIFFVAEPNAFISNSPEGFCIFVTDNGTISESKMFNNVNEEIYNSTKTASNIVIADPFKKTIDGKEYTVISVLKPVFDSNNKFLGMVGSNIDTSVLNNAPYDNGDFKSFSNQIICGHQTFIVHTTNPEAISKSFLEATVSTNPDTILDAAKNATTVTFLDKDKNGDKNYRAFVPFYVGSSKVVWLSGTSISEDEFNETIVEQILNMFVVMMGGLIIMAILFFFIIKKELAPIKELEFAAREMAKGNLNVEILHSSNDELGSLADSFKLSAETISSYVNEIDIAMESMADGNFEDIQLKEFVGDFKHIEISIYKFIEKMSQTLFQINQAANSVSGGAQQVSMESQVLSQGTSEQASSVQELSYIISEISNQVRTNAENANDAKNKVTIVGSEMEDGDKKMKNLIIAMDVIKAKSAEINKIIKVIDDIAFQTNILALNAAVEAARAGSSGKGFAVVADEVRNLAGKSAEAAQGTAELIESSIRAVEKGAELADETGRSLEVATKDSKEIIELINRISKSFDEEAAAIDQVNVSVQQISNVVQSNSATSEEGAASSEELSQQADILNGLVSKFKIK